MSDQDYERQGTSYDSGASGHELQGRDAAPSPAISAPQVHNRYKGTAPAGAVYIGRGSPWGNPFVIGIDGDRNEVCDRFEREVLPTLDLAPLIGKHLVCYCAPQRCHGDAILAAVSPA